jgi:predicted lipid-binding transport protein (Tim44 family)
VTTVIILAMVFVFVALRLWSVLGRRTGHEQPIAKPDLAPARSPSVTLVKPEAAALATDRPAAVPGATAGLRSITAADPRFDVAAFMEGARSAYRQILEAFWRADEPRLAELVDPEVAQAFGAAIAERREAGHVLDNRLVAIENAQIEQAWVEGPVAHIKIRFEADVAAVTRNAEGEVIAGSLSDAVQTNDLWTFSRPLKSPDPNWTLTETDESA